jgi:hypothetical protein
MELDKKDLENLIIESLMVRVKKKQEVEESIVGGIKGIAGGVKSLYKMGSLKSDIESTLKKINGDKQNLEKLKQRADELGLQTSDAALYKKLTDAISAISDTPASAPAPAAGPGGASTGMAAGATPSVVGLASSSPSSVATRAASSGVSGGGSTSFTTTTVGGPSGGTAATRATRTRGAGATAAPTSSPTSAAASAPEAGKAPEATAPPAKAPEAGKAPEAAATAPAAGKKSIKPQNKEALIAAVKNSYLTFNPKDEAVRKAIESIYNDFTTEIKSFAVKSGQITEEDKKEIKLSEIIKKHTASLDTNQKKEVNKFVDILSQLTINFGYGNVFAEDFGVGVIVDAEPPEEELEVDANELEAGEDESSTPTDTSTTAASTDASTDTSTADASTDTGQGPSIGEPDDLDFLHDPSDPQYIEFSNSLKKAGITDELVIKYVSRFMFPDQDDQYEITENKVKYIKQIILEEAKRTIDLTRFLKSRGYENKAIKQVLLALQKFSEKVVLAAKAKEIAEMPETTEPTSPATAPDTVSDDASSAVSAGVDAAVPSAANAATAALQADDVTVARVPVKKAKAKKVANKAKSAGKSIAVADTKQPNAVSVALPVGDPSEDDRKAIVAAASELGADKTEVESDISAGPAAVVAPANNSAAAALADPDVALKAAQGTESPTARRGKRGKAAQPSVPEPSTKQPPAPSVEEPEEEDVITLKTPQQKAEFKGKVSGKIAPIFKKYENLMMDFQSDISRAFDYDGPIPLKNVIFSINKRFEDAIKKLQLSEATRGRKPKAAELKQDADLSPEQKRDLLLSFQQELINAFKELYAEYNGSESVETAPVKGKFAPPRRIQKDPSLYKKIKKGSDDSDDDEEEEENEESDDKSIRYIEPTDDLADDEDEENINRRRRRKTDDTYDDGDKGDDEPEEVSFKQVRESLQPEPMFILKEGVFVLNKKVL